MSSFSVIIFLYFIHELSDRRPFQHKVVVEIEVDSINFLRNMSLFGLTCIFTNLDSWVAAKDIIFHHDYKIYYYNFIIGVNVSTIST